MRKTSVYLPDELKDDLAEVARRAGRSEAELIRVAIERLVQGARDEPAPARRIEAELPTGPALVGVGVGPSDPDLITERALAVLRAADRVCAPSTGPDAISRAEAVVRTAAPDVLVDRLTIEIGGDPGTREASLRAAADDLLASLDQGALVAVVVLGDPNVYSVFTKLAALVRATRPKVPVASVPGIMGFQDLAARSGTVLVEGDEELTVVSLTDRAEALDPLLAEPGTTVVVYKGGRHLPAVAELLERHDRTEGAVVGELLGLAGGRHTDVAAVADRPASYLATVVVPARREAGA